MLVNQYNVHNNYIQVHLIKFLQNAFENYLSLINIVAMIV